MNGQRPSRTLASGRRKTVVRFFFGGVLDFCRALAGYEASMSTEAKYFIPPWAAHRLVLNGGDYNQSAVSRAPVMFNIINTSNLADCLGVQNMLIHARPLLLVRSPSSKLYTESVLDAFDSLNRPVPPLGCHIELLSTKFVGNSVYLSPEWPNIPGTFLERSR